jgi:acetyl-CoA decarbonylase/synthase complex subunit alpha
LKKRNIEVDIKEMKTNLGLMKDIKLSVGGISEKTTEGILGPTPFPSSTDLREWDMKLLERYKPFYMPFCDVCCLCTFGKCDLSNGKRGACGLNMEAQQSRTVLISCCIGTATHTAHARHLIEELIKKFGRKNPLDVGGNSVDIVAPVTQLVTGIKPRHLGDIEDILDYVESEITQLLSSTHTGQEGSNIDFESKILHAGMMDHVALEVADLAQISTFNFPKSDPESALVDTGLGVVDSSKPVIMVVGHNVPPAIGIMDYMTEKNLASQLEVCGLCCTAHDIARYNPKAKIVGPISWQLRFIRSGIPDVIVVDEQCIRADALEEAKKIKTPVIASSPKNCLGLKDRTKDSPDEIVADLISGKMSGVLILDPDKVGEVAVRTSLGITPKRKKFKNLPELDKLILEAKRCTRCNECRRACPNDMLIPEAMSAAAQGDLTSLNNLYDVCVGCGRCEEACPQDLDCHSFIVKAAEKKIKDETFKTRSGRGAIQDVEIRKVGGPIVLGEIPGVIAHVGCSNYAKGGKEVAEMIEEFAKRRYIILTSGCAAITAGMHKNEEGKTLYETFPGDFDAGCVLNVGSCVSNAHIAGAAIKIARIFGKRNLNANYEEIADYILNRVGAVGISWGAMSQKAASIASGFWRLGIPVIVGPHGSKYRRMLLGRKDRNSDWQVYDARTGEHDYVGPSPEHLFYAAETKEEAMVMMAKLCIRPNDTTKGRAMKLSHYIDLHKRFYGRMPDDIHLYVRRLSDVPITMKDEIIRILDQKEWKEKNIPDPTILPRMIRKKER